MQNPDSQRFLIEAHDSSNVCVLKFGGSVLGSEDDYSKAALEIYRHVRNGEKVIAVVSALAGQTDALIEQACRIGGNRSDGSAVARLARIGELQSAAILALALGNIGVLAETLDPHEIGLFAEGPALDADLVDLNVDALHRKLISIDVIIVPGFVAVHEEHGAATLGRGGTDLTAVFIAARIGASRVRLIKDVDGVYANDPAVHPRSHRFEQLGFAKAKETSGRLIQMKAIDEAEADGVEIEVAAIDSEESTHIGNFRIRRSAVQSCKRIRITLLGCGSVGGGVLAHLNARPDLFEVGPVLVRHPEKHSEDASFTADPDEALRFDPEILVEAMGGAELAGMLMQTALKQGAHVVTANKVALAEHWEVLHATAVNGGSKLRFSAAVGGSTPILEAVSRLKGSITAIEGIMNGTSNFVLSRLGEGWSLEQALVSARELGLAEEDPSADLDGDDAAAKLSILARLAFGRSLPVSRIPKTSLRDPLPPELRESVSGGKLVLKQVGRCRLLDDGEVETEVGLVGLSIDHALARANNEDNIFLVTHNTGKDVQIFGKGAGRWPTAASVFADIMDARRDLLKRRSDRAYAERLRA
jgi:homoserine dehydrogenase